MQKLASVALHTSYTSTTLMIYTCKHKIYSFSLQLLNKCRPSAAAALVVAPPAAALLRRLRCRCCEDTLGVPRRRLQQQLPAVPGLQVDRPPVRGTRQPRQRRRARHADRRRREVQYSLLVHHTADELRAFGLTDEMLQDQMWQKTARPGELNHRFMTNGQSFFHPFTTIY